MKREPKRKTNFFVSTTSTTYSDSYVRFDKINKTRYTRTHGRVKKGVDSVDGKRMLDSTLLWSAIYIGNRSEVHMTL